MIDSYLLYTQQLKGEYKETFNKIDMYVSSNCISEDTKEEIMGNLLDVFLNAQEEGRMVEKIIGKNIEKFCKHFCSELGWKEHFINYVERIRGVVAVVFLMSVTEMLLFLVEYFRGKDVDFFTYKTDFNIAMYGILVGTFIMVLYFINMGMDLFTRKLMFKSDKAVKRRFVIILAVLIIISVTFFCIFISQIDKTDTLYIPTWISFMISGILVVAYFILTKERRKNRKDNTISFYDYYKKGKNA